VVYVARAQRPAEEESQRSGLDSLVYHKYYVDELYNTLFVKPTMALSRGLYKFVENGIIDPIANGVGRVTLAGGQLLRFVQTGSVETYLLLMVLGIVLILGLNMGRM
jgi:NADH-quinone oxidoreductase subunit L